MPAPRRSLQTALASLGQEIEAALHATTPMPTTTRLEADRVIVSLQLAWEARKAADGTVELAWVVPETPTGPGSGSNTVTFEFKSAEPTLPAGPAVPATDQRPEPAPAAPRTLEGEEAERAVTLLAQLFGPPGFDSSARATVFREALDGLGEDQIHAVLEGLDGKLRMGADEPFKTVRHLVRGVLKSGPLGSPKGGEEMLQNLFRQHPVAAVLRLIEARWRTQQHWVDISPRQEPP